MKIKVCVWERADQPEKGRIYEYKRGWRTLKEDAEGYYVLLNGFKAYVDYKDGQYGLDTRVRYYVPRRGAKK